MYPGSASFNGIQHKESKPLSFSTDPEDNQTPPLVKTPSVNILETDAEYQMSVAVPGLSCGDFKVEIEKGTLAISGQRKPVSVSVFDRKEYDFSSWTRKFILPADADPLLAHARYRNGELTIHVPRGNQITANEKATVYVY